MHEVEFYPRVIIILNFISF